jgi:predicted nucleotidyltransferase
MTSKLSPLPAEHQRVLDRVVGFFQDCPGVVGGCVSGSVARGDADEYSDLDVAIFFADEETREAAWTTRWEWEIARWFHRFDADHVKPYFVIYLFEPGVKADLPLHLVTDPPAPGGAPYEALWDTTGHVVKWVEASNAGRQDVSPDWSAAVHEEERIWAWIYYCVRHVQRGEYYDVASDFQALREIVEAWHARLRGKALFDIRRVHEREPETMSLFADLFPRPARESQKRALSLLIEIHDRQREEIERSLGITWRTSSEGRELIRKLVESL